MPFWNKTKKIEGIIKLSKNLKKRYDKKIIKKLKDIKDCFYDKSEINKILKRKNPLIYRVFIKKIKDINVGLTVMESGTVGKEFYFTKGHKHKKPSSEIYILLKGKGNLIIQNKKIRVIKLQKNKKYIVPKKSAHRLINIGNKKLEVLAIYRMDAGHNYHVKFKKRLFKK